MKQVDKTILRLVYGISVMSLHLHYFPAVVEVRWEKDGERIWERRSRMSLHLHYFPADGGGSFGEGGRKDLGEEVEEL